MRCIKCGDEMTRKEMACGKSKCAICLQRGYKYALGQRMKEGQELQDRIDILEADVVKLKRIITQGKGQEQPKILIKKVR